MIVLDTNVLSEMMRAHPNTAVAEWMRRQRQQQLFTTAVTQGEILYGLRILPDGKRKQGLYAAAEALFREDFKGRVLPFDRGAALVYAETVAARRPLGRPISQFDGQIAGICRVHKAVLATRNLENFVSCGIRVLDAWQSGEEQTCSS
jgi:predicted nucleic acid-binding protein